MVYGGQGADGLAVDRLLVVAMGGVAGYVCGDDWRRLLFDITSISAVVDEEKAEIIV